MTAPLLERLTAKTLVESYWETPKLVDPPAVMLEAATEIERLQKLNARYLGALNEIASGIVPPEQHGHYLAHREAVATARRAVRGE